MRDTYYRIERPEDVPQNGALVCLWQDRSVLRAFWTFDGVTEECSPDVALFCAVLTRIRHDLIGVFVWLSDSGLWRDEWGELRPEEAVATVVAA